MKVLSKVIEWYDISEIWRDLLWKDREDIIPISCMTHDGKIDASIKHKYIPVHHGIYVNDELAGVISGHNTSEIYYRCRGIYIKESYRGFGLSKLLFGLVESEASYKNCLYIWSYPRMSALGSYKKSGFVEYGEVENSGYSGPNIRVCKKI